MAPGRLGLLLLLTFLNVLTAYAQTACLRGDRNALLAFKAGLTLPAQEFADWTNSTSCCLWPGVTCNSQGRVTKLEVAPFARIHQATSSQDLIGTTLSQLTELETLNLTHFSFDTLPTGLESLTKLVNLSLVDDRFGGSIPAEWFLIPSLQNINISLNVLNGSLPESLCHLRDLQTLSINQEKDDALVLGGPIPDCLGALVKLTTLELSNNLFSGSIPETLGSLTKLQVLRLDNNKLTGAIPASFGSLTSLQILSLQGNVFTGSLPQDLGALVNLQEFELGVGQDLIIDGAAGLSPGLFGSIPSGIGGKVLRVLRIRGTSVSGSIPHSLGLTSLTELVLNNNGLSGTIPASLAGLEQLEVLDLSDNRLSGPLPALGQKTLTNVLLGNNQLTGIVPPTLATALSLTTLDISNNQLTGPIPSDLGNTLVEGSLDLSNNKLTGSFPASLWTVASVILSHNLIETLPTGHLDPNVHYRLEKLWLDSNALSGVIPPWVFEFRIISSIDLSNNNLESPLPPLTAHHLFQYLNLSHNLLGGSIPEQFTNVNSLDLSFNQLTGPIPAGFSNTVFLNNLILANNQLSGSIPDAILTSTFYHSIDLSHNNLTGPLPSSPTTTSFMRLIDFSHNQLSGNISEKLFTSFASIQKIKLNHNKLTGTIPDMGQACTSGWDALSTVTLNDNLLTGTLAGATWIPQCAGKFRVFDISGNALKGTIPDFSSWTTLEVLGLARNQFTGAIPSHLFNPNTSLQVLDLSGNQLSAALPAMSISNVPAAHLPPVQGGPYYLDRVLYSRDSFSFSLTITTAIDLSSNHLTGPITHSIDPLTSLSVLNLAHNNFTGPLPDGVGAIAGLKVFSVASNQFSGAIPANLKNFPLTSFEENPALCGPPTPTACA